MRPRQGKDNLDLNSFHYHWQHIGNWSIHSAFNKTLLNPPQEVVSKAVVVRYIGLPIFNVFKEISLYLSSSGWYTNIFHEVDMSGHLWNDLGRCLPANDGIYLSTNTSLLYLSTNCLYFVLLRSIFFSDNFLLLLPTFKTKISYFVVNTF